MNVSKRLILILVLLAVLLSAGIVFRVFLMNSVIMPASLVLWAVIRVFLSIPQEAYWVGLVFTAFVLGLRLLPIRSETLKRPAAADSRLPVRRFEYWQKIIKESSLSSENRIVLENNLRDLLVNVIAQEEHVSPNSLREDIEKRRLDIPEEIYDVLEGLNTGRQTRKSWMQQFFRKLSFNYLNTRINQSSNLESAEKLLRYLENYAEIDHDRTYS